MKFEEAIKDALRAMKNAEVKSVAYFVKDPDKEHASAIDGKIYLDRKKAEKVAKKLGLEVEAWLGLYKGGVGEYKIPKKYKLVEDK